MKIYKTLFINFVYPILALALILGIYFAARWAYSPSEEDKNLELLRQELKLLQNELERVEDFQKRWEEKIKKWEDLGVLW